MAFPILIIVILIILIVWWALLRNARKYKPDFPVHTHEEEHASARGADTYTAETAAAHAMGSQPASVVAEAPKADLTVEPAPVGEPPAPVEPAITPPADQPFATDYGTPAEVVAPAGSAGIFETRAQEMQVPVADDLAILEGIGPRVKEVLAGAGIHTFADLAATEVNTLRQILEGANLRFLDPGTWPEQAGLAAEGRMEELQTLMDSLRGGRRVADG